MDFGYDPPYLDGTEVKYIKYETDQRFVRVYSSKGKQVSSWIMKYEDIEGLTAREIKIKYSLPDEPYYGEMVVFLHYLLVHPDYQGNGIAAHLLDTIKEKYKEMFF